MNGEMNKQEPLGGGSEEELLGYMQGDVDPVEMEKLEALFAANPDSAEMVRLFSHILDNVSDELVGLVPSLPSDEIRSKILSNAANQNVSRVVRRSEDGWQESGPGIEFKVLFKEPDSDRVTVLFRATAGSRMPRHRHVGLEECLVIEGTLWTDGVLLKAGDYIVTEDGTIHDDTWTETGALVMLKTMMSDEMLA